MEYIGKICWPRYTRSSSRIQFERAMNEIDLGSPGQTVGLTLKKKTNKWVLDLVAQVKLVDRRDAQFKPWARIHIDLGDQVNMCWVWWVEGKIKKTPELIQIVPVSMKSHAKLPEKSRAIFLRWLSFKVWTLIVARLTLPFVPNVSVLWRLHEAEVFLEIWLDMLRI